ncbi:MAG TPA: radical SAM protein [Polyangiaceae bacterium]
MKASRIVSVVTNRRCNQACLWCTRRSEHDDPRSIQLSAVKARIEEGLASGAEEVVLTGGEPTMRGDVAELVAHARSHGARRVGLETNATLLDGTRARALKDAGLDVARVNVPVFGDSCDALTRDPGGFARALAGMKALGEQGIAIEAAVTLVSSTAGHVGELPRALREALGSALRSLFVSYPVEAADPSELLPFDRAATAVVALEHATRPHELAVRMSTGDPLPPCAFDAAARGRVTRLYAMTPGAPRRAEHTHVAACEDCTLRDRCPGVPDAYLARFGTPPMHPVTDDRTRRRLAVISSIEEQVDRELVSRSLATDATGAAVMDETIRVLFRCNQSCTFCFVSTHLPAPSAGVVASAIREAAARGSRIVLSGGEPTLDPRLVEWVKLARSLSTREIVLQTNAVRLDDGSLVARLEEAGLGEAFVSLHGATAAVSDAVTEAPGTFARTVRGIDHLHASRIQTVLNFVVCERNRHELVDHVRAIAARWPRAFLNVSFVAPSSDVVPRDRALVPRYSDVLPEIAAAVAESKRLGVKIVGFESMCGLPLCLVPRSLEELAPVDVPEGFDGGEFVKTDACSRCSLATRCWGIRRGYAEIHGIGELIAR